MGWREIYWKTLSRTVQKVSHVSAQNRKYSVVAILADETDKVDTHLFEEFFFRDAQHLYMYKIRRDFHSVFYVITDVSLPEIHDFSGRFVFFCYNY